jgi:PST family polysaccharide transporter
MTFRETSLPPSTDREAHLRTDDLINDLGRRTARGGAITIFSQGAKFFLSMVGTVILARLLYPEDYGLVGMVAVVTGFISIFKDLGLSVATIQRAEINSRQISTLFWVNLLVSLGLMLVTVAIAPGIAWFYGEPKLTAITIAYAAGFLFGGLAVQHEALLRRRMRFLALAAAEIIALVVSSVMAITMAWYGARYWALVSSQLCLGLIYGLAVWIACGWRPGLPVRNSGVREMLAFGGNLTGFGVVNYFARNLDNLLIGRFWGPGQLGLYARAYQLLLLPIDQMITPITAVAVPALSRLKDSPDRYRQAYLRLLEKVALLTMPLMAFMIVSADWLVAIVLGPKWTGVSRIFSLLGIAGLVQPLASTTGWLFVTQGRTQHMFKWGMIGSTITVVAIVAGLKWGAVGVAASYSFTSVIVVIPLLFWFVSRSGPVRMIDFYRTVAPVALATVCSFGVLLFLKYSVSFDSSLIGLAVSLLVVVVTTLSILVLLPQGRLVLWDLKQTIALLFGKDQSHKKSQKAQMYPENVL